MDYERTVRRNLTLGGMTIEGNMVTCDGLGGNCQESIRIQSGPLKKTETAAKRLGWKFVGEREYCPRCA